MWLHLHQLFLQFCHHPLCTKKMKKGWKKKKEKGAQDQIVCTAEHCFMLPLLLLSKTQRQPSYLVSNLICHVHSHTDTHISDSSCTDQLSLCLKSDIWLSDKTSWFWILVWIVSNLDIHHIHCALCLNTLDTASSFIKLLLLEAILHFHPSTFATNTLHYLLYCNSFTDLVTNCI